jgi:hypothetical protein
MIGQPIKKLQEHVVGCQLDFFCDGLGDLRLPPTECRVRRPAPGFAAKVLTDYVGALNYEHRIAVVTRLKGPVGGGATSRRTLDFEVEKHAAAQSDEL